MFFSNFAPMNVKTEAIVLHLVKVGESKMVVDLFTREAGRLPFVMTLSKSGKGRMKKQYFQSMTLLEVECDVRPNVRFQRLTDVRLLVPFASLPFAADKLAISLFVGEFLCHALRSEQRNVPLFDYVKDSLMWLDAAARDYANFHLTFLMRMSRFLGFFPNLEGYAEGCVFDLRNGCFSPWVPTHRDYLAAPDARVMLQLMRMDFATMRFFRLSHVERNRITEVLLRYYRIHLPDFPELKSLPVLQELFADEGR